MSNHLLSGQRNQGTIRVELWEGIYAGKRRPFLPNGFRDENTILSTADGLQWRYILTLTKGEERKSQ